MLNNQPRTTMFRGEETPIAKVAEELGLPYSRVYSRTTRRETGDDIEANPGKRKPHWNTVELYGEPMTLKEAVERNRGPNYNTVSHRISRGMTVEEALVHEPFYVEIDGKKMSLKDAVREYGAASYDTTNARIRKLGWSLEKALATPAKPIKNKGNKE